MKNLAITAVLIPFFLFTGCAEFWSSPATQKAFAVSEQVLVSVAVNALLGAAMNGGKFDTQQLQMNSYYAIANGLRQLQTTPEVVSPLATKEVILSTGLTQKQTDAVNQILFDNAVKAMHAGYSPDKASEINAKALDKAAADLAK
jgi:hypothetical protein